MWRDPVGFNKDAIVGRRVSPFERNLDLIDTIPKPAAESWSWEDPFPSHPREWCFSQFKDVALAFLDLQDAALTDGLEFKTASPFDIDFRRGRPTIDTSRLRKCGIGPWKPYQSFCRHFLAPLYLMQHTRSRHNAWTHSSGVSLQAASRHLGLRSWFELDCLLHIHLNALMGRVGNDGCQLRNDNEWDLRAKRELLHALKFAIENIRLVENLGSSPSQNDGESLAYQETFVRRFIGTYPHRLIYDLTDGQMYRVAHEHGVPCVVLNANPDSVESAYRTARLMSGRLLLALISDSFSVSPFTRPLADLVVAAPLPTQLRQKGPREVAAALAVLGTTYIVEHPGTPNPSRGDSFETSSLPAVLAAFDGECKAEQIIAVPHTAGRLIVFRKRSL